MCVVTEPLEEGARGPAYSGIGEHQWLGVDGFCWNPVPPFTTPPPGHLLGANLQKLWFLQKKPKELLPHLSRRLDDRVLLPLKQCCCAFAVVSWFELFLVQHMPPLLPSLTTKPMTRRDGEEPVWDPPLVTEAITVSSNTEPECITHLRLAVSLFMLVPPSSREEGRVSPSWCFSSNL